MLSLKPPHQHPRDNVHGEQKRVVGREVGNRLGVEALAAWYLLGSVRGLGPMSAAAIHAAGLTPAELLRNPDLYPLKGKRAQDVKKGIVSLTGREYASARIFAQNQLRRARELDATIISYADIAYPPLVRGSNNPIPILWARGNTSILQSRKTVACVGSRKIRTSYSRLQAAFVDVAVEEGFVIASGFAVGADSVGHRRALEAGGTTICVMPCGVDLVFPPENRKLWRELLDSGRAVFLSEFAFGRRAQSLTLRKRNKLIVAVALGVLVGQTRKSGGAMNAFRFGLEQKKPVATFDPDGTNETSGNKKIKEFTKGHTSALPATVVPENYRSWLREL